METVRQKQEQQQERKHKQISGLKTKVKNEPLLSFVAHEGSPISSGKTTSMAFHTRRQELITAGNDRKVLFYVQINIRTFTEDAHPFTVLFRFSFVRNVLLTLDLMHCLRNILGESVGYAYDRALA